MSDVNKVLFICVHNAARSQMAEAILRKLGGTSFEASSAGFEPREINPLVIEAMHLIGVDISNVKSKSVFELFRTGHYFNYAITVCDEASTERCPVFPGITRRLSWSFDDPSTFEGTHAERLSQVVRVRDEIHNRIESWLKALPHQTRSLRA